MKKIVDAPDILDSGDVARLFHVDPKSIVRWAKDGRLAEDFRTLGGHRRWYRATVEAALNGTRPAPREAGDG